MQSHLTEEQIAQLLAGEANVEAQPHAAACAECQSSIAETQHAFHGLPQFAAESAQRNDSFWREQRLAISARIARDPGPYARFAWGLAFASLVLLAALLNPAGTSQATLHASAAADPDHELLMDVEASVRRRIPEALAPAELLVAELDSAVKAQGNP